VLNGANQQIQKTPPEKSKGRKIAVPPKLAENCPLYEFNGSPEFPTLI